MGWQAGAQAVRVAASGGGRREGGEREVGGTCRGAARAYGCCSGDLSAPVPASVRGHFEAAGVEGGRCGAAGLRH